MNKAKSVSLLIFAAMILTACAHAVGDVAKDQSGTALTTPVENEADRSIEGKTPAQEATGEVKEFTMTAKQWEFSPSEIVVNQGDTVKLKIKSVDVAHGFAISEFNVNENLTPGEVLDVEFVADKKGTFSFFCSVFCGSGHADMKGTLVVK